MKKFSLRELEEHAEDLNKVIIKSAGATFPRLKDSGFYDFPIHLNISDRIDRTLKGCKGHIDMIFKHTKGHVVFVIKMLDGKFKDKHILIGRTGIQKVGKMSKKLQIIDSSAGVKARKKYKPKSKKKG